MTRTTAQESIDRSKDGVARRLAESHYRVDPSVLRIVRLLAPKDEESPSEPIKLLEVSDETIMSGIMPVWFGPHEGSGIFFPSVIVEVQPEEFEMIKTGQLPLPQGWTLGDEISKPADEP